MQNLYIKGVGLASAPAPGEEDYYMALPAVLGLKKMEKLRFTAPVTFFVGENGTGKSTLMEALAVACGFNAEGGTINFNFSSKETHSGLYKHLQLTRGVYRPKDGFFLRAESFYNTASEVDRLDTIGLGGEDDTHGFLQANYGGKSLHKQSHGESFMSLVLNRFSGNGLYILDEPEAALSPSRQMALLAAIQSLVQNNSQFIIATHSPVVMAYPGAQIWQLLPGGIAPAQYEELEHVQLTKRFLHNPAAMLRHLLQEPPEE